MANRINKRIVIEAPKSGRIRAWHAPDVEQARTKRIKGTDRMGDKAGTDNGLSPEWIGRGRGKSKAEAMSKSFKVSGGVVQSNWLSAKAYSRSRNNQVHRDGWNKGTLVRWKKD